jgi:hypothetical protein
LAGVIWNAECQEDSWAWVGYVLVSVYLLIILLHASIVWLTRPLAEIEYSKYTPLDYPKSSSAINDLAYGRVKDEAPFQCLENIVRS